MSKISSIIFWFSFSNLSIIFLFSNLSYFLYFFENPFYLSIKKFNLSAFGFEPLEIVLPPKTKMFNDLLEKSNCQDFNEYKYKMEKCAKKYFILSNLSNSIDEKEIWNLGFCFDSDNFIIWERNLISTIKYY